MIALCKCTNGHGFGSRVIEDDPSINSLVLADDLCPECGAEFEVAEMECDCSDVREL